MLTNLAKGTIAALAVVLVAITTAAAAQPPMPHGPQYYACYTDEGQGRFVPCDVG
jgi:hypothetical protein